MKIALFTSGRHDWNILEPVAAELAKRPSMQVEIIAGGLHTSLSPRPSRLGNFPVHEWVDASNLSDQAVAIGQTAGWTTALMAGALHRRAPQALLLLGDRSEALAAGLAATCLKIPIIHLHGGEETEGALDNVCRHALSKLAHVHFVSLPEFGARLRQMGEDPDRIFVVGAPGLDRLSSAAGREDRQTGPWTGRGRPLLAFTHHPTTLGGLSPEQEIEIVLKGLGAFIAGHPDAFTVMTAPNEDEGHNAVFAALQRFQAVHPERVLLVNALGSSYFDFLRDADAMVGNSSSGIIEAASFQLPVVNIGDRQKGRHRGANVLDTDLDPEDIRQRLTQATHPDFRAGLAGLVNPYGDGRASQRIVDALESLAPSLASGCVRKAFRDLPGLRDLNQ